MLCMGFDKEKNEFLRKKDKSRKGSMDIKIKSLVEKINSLDDFFTTSSCSGRILISAIPESNKKNDVQYLFCSHEKTNFRKIKTSIKKLPNEEVWLRVEPAILHIACKNIEKGSKLLNLARDIGFRRSGIISIGKSKIILEIVSTEKIEALLGKNKELLIGEKYLNILIKEGNKKLEKTWKKINRLEKCL